MKLFLQNGVMIDVTRELVNQILDFLWDEKVFKTSISKRRQYNLWEWIEQFDNKKMIRLHKIKINIFASDNVNINL